MRGGVRLFFVLALSSANFCANGCRIADTDNRADEMVPRDLYDHAEQEQYCCTRDGETIEKQLGYSIADQEKFDGDHARRCVL